MRRLWLLALFVPQVAHAFCGFFVGDSDQKLTNNASQVALLRKGHRIVLTMSNNYKGPPEGRYIIRHYWSGPVKCDHPQYGRWGGPPNGAMPEPTAAKGLANAQGGTVALGKVVRSPVPTLGIPGQPPPRRKK